MLILHDPRCAEYGSSLRPEQPARVIRSVAHLKSAHPDWTWRVPAEAVVTDEVLRDVDPDHGLHLCVQLSNGTLWRLSPGTKVITMLSVTLWTGGAA